MSYRSCALTAIALAVTGVRWAGAADAPPTASDLARVEGELARVQHQLGEQRQLIFQLMQMHDALLKYLQTGGGSAAPSSAPGTPPVAARPETASTTTPRSSPMTQTGAISGHVRPTGNALPEAYVYLDGPRTVPAHPPTIEIKQESRRFSPSIAVVPVGAHVLFPNHDTVFHSVFSNTPGDAFDVGTLKEGQTSQPIALLKPGNVEVFCNIHSRMRADVLVVPNGHWTRVHEDGSFQLPSIPVGSRRIVLWSPTFKPVSQLVEVTAAGATITFTPEGRSPLPHLNKSGAAYGSYEN